MSEDDIPNYDDNEEEGVAGRHLRGDDRQIYAAGDPRRLGRETGEPRPDIVSNGPYANTADGIMAVWSDCVYADSEEQFREKWELLYREFSKQQQSSVGYLEPIWLPVANDFADWATRQHRNYGVRVTSRTEAVHGM